MKRESIGKLARRLPSIGLFLSIAIQAHAQCQQDDEFRFLPVFQRSTEGSASEVHGLFLFQGKPLDYQKLEIHVAASVGGRVLPYLTFNKSTFVIKDMPHTNATTLHAWATLNDQIVAKALSTPGSASLKPGQILEGSSKPFAVNQRCVAVQGPDLTLFPWATLPGSGASSTPAPKKPKASLGSPSIVFVNSRTPWYPHRSEEPASEGESAVISFDIRDLQGLSVKGGTVFNLSGEKVPFEIHLEPGEYRFQAVAEGFETSLFVVSVASERIEVTTANRREPFPRPAGDSRKVTIPIRLNRQQPPIGSDPIDRTSIAELAVFSTPYAEALPLPGWRSPDSLALLLAGVVPPSEAVGRQTAGIALGFGTAGDFSVNGLRPRDNSFTIDGSDNNDEDIGVRRRGIIAAFPQAIESLSEFSVVTARANSTYGRGIAGFADGLTIVGGHSFHGSAWGFAAFAPLKAADALSVKNSAYTLAQKRQLPITSNGLESGQPVTFDTIGSGIGLPFLVDGSGIGFQSNPTAQVDQFHRIQSGFVVTGPLDKWGTTFALSFERRSLEQTDQENFAVATPLERQICGPLQQDCAPFQRLSHGYAVSFRGDALWSLIPFPNNPLGPFGGNTFTETLPSNGAANVYVGQIGRNFFLGSASHALTIRYNGSNESSILPETGAAIFSSVKPFVLTQNAALLLSSSRGSSLNLFRASFGNTRVHFDEVRDPYLSSQSQPSLLPANTPFLLNAPLLLNTAIGSGPTVTPRYTVADSTDGRRVLSQGHFVICGQLAFASNCPPVWADQVDTAALGQIAVAGFSQVGTDVYNFPQQRSNETLQLADTMTTTGPRGQAFTFGFDVRRVTLDSLATPNLRPVAAYHGLLDQPLACSSPCGITALSPTTTVSLAEAAATQTFAIVEPGQVPDYDLTLKATQAEFFLQDHISLGQRIHLIAGLRLQDANLPEDQGLSKSIDEGNALYSQVTSENPDLAGVLKKLLPTTLQSALDPKPISVDLRFGFSAALSKDSTTVLRGGIGNYTGQFPAIISEESRNVFPSFISFSGGINTLYGSELAHEVGANQGVITTTDLASVLGRLSTTDPSNSILANLTYPNGSRNPSSIQQSITLDQKIGRHATISLAYVGTEGRHLLALSTPLGGLSRNRENTCAFVLPNTSFPLPGCYNGFVQEPIDGSLILGTKLIGSGGTSSYNAWQSTLSAHIGREVRLVSAFAWSHAIDSASDYAAVAGAFALPQSFAEPSERGSSNFDIRLRSVTHFIVESPLETNRWLRHWLFSGVATFQSGQPYTVNSATDINQDGNATDRLNNTGCLIPGNDSRTLLQAQNPLSCLAASGSSGQVGRNTFRGWPLYEVNLALSRSFHIHEHAAVELRAETYNVANHPNFGIPGRILESPIFGKAIASITPPRIVQFALKLSF